MNIVINKVVKCTSCNFKGSLRIPKGGKVKYARCPGCGKPALR
jgi:predicted RNA-binding Zn-ribbon protein involved in translation (DUF1610 family)